MGIDISLHPRDFSPFFPGCGSGSPTSTIRIHAPVHRVVSLLAPACRPGHPPGRVGFGSGQKKPGVFSSGPCPTRPDGRAVKLSPHPTRQLVGSGRVRVGPGLCKMSGSFGFFGFRVKIFSPCPARQSYRVKNFDPSPPIKLFGSGRVGLFSDGLGRVRRVGQPMPRSMFSSALPYHCSTMHA